MNQKIESQNAPKALGPYSQAIKTNGLVFISGQLGLDPKTNELKEGVEAQARQVLENLKAVLESANANFSSVVRCDIFLSNMEDFTKVNKVYEEYFTFDPKPARQTVAVLALPKNALIEISCIATTS